MPDSESRWPGARIEVGQQVLVTDLFQGDEAPKIVGKIGVVVEASRTYQRVEIEGTEYMLDSDNREIVPYFGRGPEDGVVPEEYLRHKAGESYRDEDTGQKSPTYAALMARECIRSRKHSKQTPVPDQERANV